MLNCKAIIMWRYSKMDDELYLEDEEEYIEDYDDYDDEEDPDDLSIYDTEDD